MGMFISDMDEIDILATIREKYEGDHFVLRGESLNTMSGIKWGRRSIKSLAWVLRHRPR